MKVVQSGDSKSVFIDSNEISYVRIDNKNNIMVVFRNPTKDKDNRSVFGYRGKLIGDPTGPYPDAEFQIRAIYEEQLKDEEKMIKDGILTEQEPDQGL